VSPRLCGSKTDSDNVSQEKTTKCLNYQTKKFFKNNGHTTFEEEPIFN